MVSDARAAAVVVGNTVSITSVSPSAGASVRAWPARAAKDDGAKPIDEQHDRAADRRQTRADSARCGSRRGYWSSRRRGSAAVAEGAGSMAPILWLTSDYHHLIPARRRTHRRRRCRDRDGGVLPRVRVLGHLLRALPDARDGLKPVQRRILYGMTDMGLRPDRGHVKSSSVVGEVMGKFHPHGDASIYDAMVRLAQDFVLRVPLIDGHGNFGSLDDGPAAPRYTEARLAWAATALTDGLDEDVVDFIPNYDNAFMQPDVLPSAFPNLLVNGASGIAVGMATNMAPHNLIEVVAAARYLLDIPDATLEDLMAFVPGARLPDRRHRSSGSTASGTPTRPAAARSRPARRCRSRASTARKTGLVVTELPYLVGPERVIEKIKDGVQSKKISGISDVTDLTDRTHGLRLVIGIKTGFSPDAVLEQLYRLTPLEESFSINNVALVGGGPQTLGLRELLQVYLDHRLVGRHAAQSGSGWRGGRSGCTWSRVCSSRSSTSTRSSRSSAPATTASRRAPG